MPRRSCRFLGLSTGSLSARICAHLTSLGLERERRRRVAPFARSCPAHSTADGQTKRDPSKRSTPSKRPVALGHTERLLIDQYLGFYLSLLQGARQPMSEAQRHFVAVSRGMATPLTAHEFAFTKWRTLRGSY